MFPGLLPWTPSTWIRTKSQLHGKNTNFLIEKLDPNYLHERIGDDEDPVLLLPTYWSLRCRVSYVGTPPPLVLATATTGCFLYTD
jgi:hypothetical protein